MSISLEKRFNEARHIIDSEAGNGINMSGLYAAPDHRREPIQAAGVDPLVAAILSARHETVKRLLGLVQPEQGSATAHSASFFKAQPSANQNNSKTLKLGDHLILILKERYGDTVLTSPQRAALAIVDYKQSFNDEITPETLQTLHLIRDNSEAVKQYCESRSHLALVDMRKAAEEIGENALLAYQTDLELPAPH